VTTQRLTKRIIDAAAPRAADYELRDRDVPGFLCKITPNGRKVFMVQYRTAAGTRRKPALGRFGQLTVEQARKLAQDWLSAARKGLDPSTERMALRKAPTVKDLCQRFMDEHSRVHNRPKTIAANEYRIEHYIVPALGTKKIVEVTRRDIVDLMQKHRNIPTAANHNLSCLKKMFNLAEVWELRPDGSNPCRHVKMFPRRGKTRLITDAELARVFIYLDEAEREGLEFPQVLLAVRLQFAFAARMSEITNLQWGWVDLANRRVAWPDSKTGGFSKPISKEAYDLLETAKRDATSPFVCPSVLNETEPLSIATYAHRWKLILKAARVPHVGTHGIRHRAATDIANSGVPLKVGMALTGHKTVTMFMSYVHTEDDPIRLAADTVAERRQKIIATSVAQATPVRPPPTMPIGPVNTKAARWLATKAATAATAAE
jgi:integrase